MPLRLGSRTVAALVAVQVVVPLVALAEGPPSRFGFHMYSGHSGLEVVATDAAGDRVPLDLDHLVARGRTELDWTEVLPEVICAGVPDVASVTVTSGDRERSIVCER